METQQSLEIDIEERKVTRTITVKLTQAEAADLHYQANEVKAERDRLVGEFEAVNDEFKANRKQLEAKLDSINAKVTESRNEECTEKRFFSENKIQVWHGEDLIEERAMTIEERQMTFGPVQTGPVLDAEEEYVTPEEDLHAVMKAEKSRNKVSLVDLT